MQLSFQQAKGKGCGATTFHHQLFIGIVGLIVMSVAGNGYGLQTSASGETISKGVVSGTVAYRERIGRERDALVEISLSDVSTMDVAAPVIAKATVASDGQQVPLAFMLRYDPGDIESDHLYALRAVIRSAGQLIFTTDRAYRVITQGNPVHVELLLVRAGQAATSTTMRGTTWRLEDLGGTGVLDRVRATLAFTEAGRVAGNTSCNRFFGTAELSGTSITFGALGSTRMSCAEAVMTQERRYLEALARAERFALDGSVLLIYYQGSPKPLRFTRLEDNATTAIGAFQAGGTEPFWRLMISRAGLRFTTPDNPKGIRFPSPKTTLAGDTVQWAGETETAAITTHIRPGSCSDGMSDRVWTHKAVVQIYGSTYRGCAEIASETVRFPNVIGEWVIVNHRIPGISVMTTTEAERWHGRKIRLGVKTAASSASTCRGPVYRYRTAAADTFLQAEFRVAPVDLGLRPTTRLGLTKVFCGGAGWTAPGGLLIRVPEGRIYTVWDGVFFELRRLADDLGNR